jgi:uncharacterized protein YecE (DUF72 family)
MLAMIFPPFGFERLHIAAHLATGFGNSLVESADGSRLVTLPNRAADRDEIRARLNQRCAIAGRDAPDRNAGDLEQTLPPGEELGLGAVVARLRHAWEKRPEGDVVRPRLAGFHRKVAAGVTGYADLRLATEDLARLAHIAVALAEVDAVRTDPTRQGDAVIYDKGAIMGGAQVLERAGEPRGCMLVQALHAELERCHRPGRQRALEPGRKFAAHLEGGYQIELARRRRVRIGAVMTVQDDPSSASVRIGCSGWMYKHWRGLFYPREMPARRWFAHYAAAFDTVEINNSFYRLPKPETFEKWRDQAPPGFRYAVKANRYLTQAKKLADCEEPLARMMAAVSALGPALGPLLYQLPPRFGLDLARLEAFLAMTPPGTVNVFEFRDPSWYCDPVFAALERHGASLCVHDMPGSASPWIAVGPIAYIRFHGTTGKYVGRYSEAGLAGWSDWMTAQARTGRSAWAYFNNDIHGHAIEDARALRAMLP